MFDTHTLIWPIFWTWIFPLSRSPICAALIGLASKIKIFFCRVFTCVCICLSLKLEQFTKIRFQCVEVFLSAKTPKASLENKMPHMAPLRSVLVAKWTKISLLLFSTASSLESWSWALSHTITVDQTGRDWQIKYSVVKCISTLLLCNHLYLYKHQFLIVFPWAQQGSTPSFALNTDLT